MKLPDGTYKPEVNFNAVLPVHNEDMPGMSNYRRIILMLDKMDMPYREIYGDDFIGNQSSELKLNQTPREFFNIIDDLLRSFDIDLELVRTLQKTQPFDPLFELVTPVYQAMVELGYKEYPDLTI